MNSKLVALIGWAELKEVDLENADIDAKYEKVTFQHSRETRQSFRNVKSVIGNFEAVGTPPYVCLEKEVKIMDTTWNFKWSGAYVCKALKYDCSMANFAEGQVPSEDDQKVVSAV